MQNPVHAFPDFEIAIPGRIIFGRGKALQAKQQILSLGKRVVFVHGADVQRAQWLLDSLTENRANTNVEVLTLSCPGEPDLKLIEKAREKAKAFDPDLVVALGGGAALDLGKALAALVPASNCVSEYLEVVGSKLPLECDPLPFVAIPTTAGTGSEVTKNAVIGIPEHNRKVSLRDNRMLADIVIVDPGLMDLCPRNVTLASGLDAITQLVEPYLSVKANPFTDSLCLNALPVALPAIRTLAERDDESAHDAMSWASMCSGMALANAGLGVVHGLAGVIGGMIGAPHGEICACLLPASLSTNRKALRNSGKEIFRIEKIENLIAQAFDVANEDAFATLKGWSRQEGIRSIVELGLQPDQFEQAAMAAKDSSSMKGNPASLTIPEITAILNASRN